MTEAEAELARALRSGRFAEAEAACRRLLAERPGHAPTLSNLGNVLEELGRPDEAEAAFRAAIAAQPGFALAHYNLALLLHGQRRLEEAEAAYAAAVAIRPDLAQAWSSRGAALRDLGRLDEAMAAFDAAVRLRPAYADAQLNQAMCRLAMGDFARGWAQYEWRWRTPQAARASRLPTPPWLGREPVAGQTVLLTAEQGLGDTLQFCRFAGQVAALGARVVLQVQPSLVRLLKRLDGVSDVVAQGGPVPPHDRWTPLMSLPLALQTRLETLPASVPYLAADPAEAAAWRARLGEARGLRLGLVWAGAARPDQPIASATDRRRSLPLSALAPLAKVAGVDLVSLQMGPAAAELAGWAGPPIADPMQDVKDFADTAAVVANLDLVISCDTSVAHLAGAMGKPVWILNRADGCWRWLTGREDSPWYPTARLFTQSVRGDWTDIVARVRKALAEVVSGQG